MAEKAAISILLNEFEKEQKNPSQKNGEKTPRGRSVFCVSYGMAQCEPRM